VKIKESEFFSNAFLKNCDKCAFWNFPSHSDWNHHNNQTDKRTMPYKMLQTWDEALTCKNIIQMKAMTTRIWRNSIVLLNCHYPNLRKLCKVPYLCGFMETSEPKWTIWWALMFPLLLNLLPQISQAYGLSPVWIRMCSLKWLGLVNDFAQTRHMCCRPYDLCWRRPLLVLNSKGATIGIWFWIQGIVCKCKRRSTLEKKRQHPQDTWS
jgi:hypothetical protein